MRRPLLLCFSPLLAALALSAAFAADQPLADWDFSKPDQQQSWYPEHSLAPFDFTSGTLKTRATAGDPYLITRAARAFEIDANDFQYLEIKLKSDKKGGGEFFWANSLDGRDLGFEAGKERGFSVRGDGEFHVYRVFPVWEGHLSRLRFDPPEDAAIEIAYIRIMQAPVTRHEPASPRWDFTKEGAGGFIPTSGLTYDAAPEGLRIALDADDGLLTGPALDWQAEALPYLTLHLTAAAPLQVLLQWADSTDGNFPGSNAVPLDLAAGEDYVSVPLGEQAGWRGSVKRLALSLTGKAGQTLTLHSLVLADKPEGPAKLTVLSFGGEQSIYATGEKGRLVLRLRNDGGATATGLRARVAAGAGTTVALESEGGALADLAPGATGEASWPLEIRQPGLAVVSVAVTGQGLLRPAAARTDLIVTAPAPLLPDKRGPSAVSRPPAAILSNDRVRLVLLPAAGGQLGSARLELRRGRDYQLMGCLPYLARLAADDDLEAAPVPLALVTSGGNASRAWLKLKGSRGGLEVTVDYELGVQQPWIEASYGLRSADGKPHALKAFQGPWLWAGEGSFGEAQDHALFPGVEWLVKGERSSSSLDIRPPASVRFAPHPNWITVPSMAVEYDRAIVGLMWDPLQKWGASHDRPAAVFASPNFVEARRNHLMGLFLPSIPDYVETNTLLAAKPYELAPRAGLSLKATFFAQDRCDVTAAPLNWYDRFVGAGKVPALPPKPRDYLATVDMSLKSYEQVLWKPDAGWMPVLNWAPGRAIGVAALYQTAAQLRPHNPDAAAWRAKAMEVAGGSLDLAFALRENGKAAAALRAVVAQGQSAAGAQPEGAAYVFHPDERRKSLGPDGATAIGLAAAPVAGLLNAALRTGDLATLEAGLKGLAFMDQFDVPRAAQVWECPLHSPDVLASGQACEAYLLGYRLTGREEYLRQAIFWARTGLPFIYAWQAPDMPQLMKYSSIPIFGATFYTGSWFGVPVQWNGLDYATACLELANYDSSFPWRQIGEGIVISGMNQQSTREKDYGCYTDNWNLVTDVECVGCMLSPGGILGNVLTLLGRPAAAGADGVRSPQGWIAVNGPARVADARLAEGTLSASLSYFPGQSGYAAVMPIEKPAAVAWEGKPLTFAPGGTLAVGQWTYDRSLGCVTARVSFGAKPGTLALSGVQRENLAAQPTTWVFDQEGDALGFTSAHDLADPVVAGGTLKLDITGGDPYFVSPPFTAAAARTLGVSLKLRVSKPGGQIFWATDSGGFAPERSLSFHVPADGQFHEVTVDLSQSPEWKGTVRQVRLDFAGGVAELQWVKLAPRP